MIVRTQRDSCTKKRLALWQDLTVSNGIINSTHYRSCTSTISADRDLYNNSNSSTLINKSIHTWLHVHETTILTLYHSPTPTQDHPPTPALYHPHKPTLYHPVPPYNINPPPPYTTHPSPANTTYLPLPYTTYHHSV